MKFNKRVSFKELSQDDLYNRITEITIATMVRKGHASKDEVLEAARATAQRGSIRWDLVNRMIRKRNPNCCLLSLSWRYYANPRNKKAHSELPSAYIAPNYTLAAGFADVVRYVGLGQKEKSIAEAKYSQQRIIASRALDVATTFDVAIHTGTRVDQLE